MECDLGQFKLTFPHLWCCNIYGFASSLILHLKACVGLEGVSNWFIAWGSPVAPPPLPYLTYLHLALLFLLLTLCLSISLSPLFRHSPFRQHKTKDKHEIDRMTLTMVRHVHTHTHTHYTFPRRPRRRQCTVHQGARTQIDILQAGFVHTL